MSKEGKKPKPDLGALFKLEFYRKQKNWKFCSEVCKKHKKASSDKSKKIPDNPKEENIFNQTYNVRTEEDRGKSLLNDAFLETDPDNVSTPSPHDKTPNSSLHLEASTIPTVEPEHTSDPSTTPLIEKWYDWNTEIENNEEQRTTGNWADHAWTGNVVWEQCECPELPEMDRGGYEGAEPVWSPAEWTNGKIYMESVWSEEVVRELAVLTANSALAAPSGAPDWPDGVPAPDGPDRVGCVPPDEVPAPDRAGCVPPGDLLRWMISYQAAQECWLEDADSSVSSERFMRDVQRAPHSSERDSNELEDSLDECEDVGPCGERVLSDARLGALGRAHARALHRVAREMRARDALRSRCEYTGPMCRCVECAIAGGDGGAGLHPPTFTDRLLACSHTPHTVRERAGQQENRPGQEVTGLQSSQTRLNLENIVSCDEMLERNKRLSRELEMGRDEVGCGGHMGTGQVGIPGLMGMSAQFGMGSGGVDVWGCGDPRGRGRGRLGGAGAGVGAEAGLGRGRGRH